MFLAKETPPAIVEKLDHAMVEAMKAPAIREKLDRCFSSQVN